MSLHGAAKRHATEPSAARSMPSWSAEGTAASARLAGVLAEHVPLACFPRHLDHFAKDLGIPLLKEVAATIAVGRYASSIC